MKLNDALVRIMSPAYRCPEFDRACAGEMRWQPAGGHVPRGYTGALGGTDEIELVLVFAEPGEPKPSRDDFSGSHLERVYQDTFSSFQVGRDHFHRNVKKILGLCWPGMTFEEQMRRTWLTESVLCSATQTTGPVSRSASTACGRRYLLPQLALLSNALVVALGNKAQQRLKALGVADFVPAYAVGPPGCNHKGAIPSWEYIAVELGRRRQRLDA